MNTSSQANYADMIELSVKTCTVTEVPAKKKRSRKKANSEQVKKAVIDTVNSQVELSEQQEIIPTPLEDIEKSDAEQVREFVQSIADKNMEENSAIKEEVDLTKVFNDDSTIPVNTITVKDRRFKPSLKKKVLAGVIATVVLVGATVGAGILTDTLGLTTYFGDVFYKEEEVVLNYDDYVAGLPTLNSEITLKDGVMSVTAKGSVYSPTQGVISSLVEEDGKFKIEIVHGEDFKTVISGLDHVYCAVDEDVYGKIPVGYSNGDGYTVCLYSADGLITDYDISGGTVVWNVTTSTPDTVS